MEKTYQFTSIKPKQFNITCDKNALEYLLKWSMKGQIRLATFSFSKPFEPHKKKEFILDFFTSPEVIGVINKIIPNWSYEKDQVEDVEVEAIPCNQTSMTFFDRVLDPENHIIRHGGGLHHCVDDVIDDFMISDELRRMVLDENSDNYGLYNEEERKELLFRIFQHFVLGGKWCQFEDKVEPYLDMTKMLYKDLVRVERNADTKEIQIRSCCVKAVVKGKQKRAIFPQDADHIQNFAYLLMDPVLRHVTLFTHEFGGQF
ncbi:UNVERIFIED_CONTAM: hypothetical protein PYX00_002221 [Menopon gallinae]|uniref:Cilia- and flagella-associated protein 300 n=1 Tax=Menopon gallinae TaxID=328185 RepID=A0AAW2IG56_9NEOP